MGRPAWHGNLARIIHDASGAGEDTRVSQSTLPSALRDTVSECLKVHAFESPSRFARTVVNNSGYACWEGSCNDRTDLLGFETGTLPTCALWLQL
jgi:hypothetical protein